MTGDEGNAASTNGVSAPPAAAVPAIAVVIPTYNRRDGLERLLLALDEQDDPGVPWEVIVVDDCTAPGELERLAPLLAERPYRARALSTPVNSGPAVARNIGWRDSAAPILAFLDDDVVPAPGWLGAAYEAMAANPRLGVVQGHTKVPDGVDVHALPIWFAWRDITAPGPYFEGCNIIYRREALEQTTGFDEEIGWWGEDSTLGWQVVEAGWERSWAPEAIVVHDIEFRGPKWYLRMGWKERNLILLAARHPGYREEAFWKPWAYRKRDAAFVLAMASAAVATRWRPAAVGVLPYLWLGRPSIREPNFPRHCAEVLAVDAARSAGHLIGAVEHRVAII